jgi:hypothetical protein
MSNMHVLEVRETAVGTSYCTYCSSNEENFEKLQSTSMRLFNRMWELRFSRRQIFLLCLITGILAARGFGKSNESPRSYLLVYALPVGSAPGGLDEFDPADGRELSEYALGGHVNECGWSEVRGSRCLKRREEARRFIYEHWRSKQRAYIAVDFSCDDCSPTLHIFIEPTQAGEWRIATVLEEPRYPAYRGPDAFDVKYRKTTEDDLWSRRATRVLSFRDRSNVEVDSF